jgi:serine/threonine protein kinase
MIDRTGQHLGHYRLLRLVGHGAFADVYLGEHLFLRTQVAVKVLRSALTSSSQHAFLREAQIIAQLEHPHIVRVQDFGIETGTNTPFLVMTYAPHGSLRQHYSSGTRPTAAEIISYVQQAADALHYAHDRKLVHCDVKPENLLLGQQNEVLLSDFGVAFLRQWPSHWQSVWGTPGYAAPELSWSNPLPASDQYALAVIVYEWFSQSHPYQSLDATGQYTFQPVPLRERVPRIPPHVNAVVMTALAENPRQRFSSIQAFATALEQACQPFLAAYAPESLPVNSSQSEPPAPMHVLSEPAPPPPIVWPQAWGCLIGSLLTWVLLGCLVALGTGVFDLVGIPLILGNWQHSAGVFWGSLVSSVVLLVLVTRRSFRPVLGYLAVLVFGAAWGTVGWILGTDVHFRWLPALVLPILFGTIGFLISACIHSYYLPVMVRNRSL